MSHVLNHVGCGMLHSSPCTAGELVKFLETTSKRLRVGVVTAGWRDNPPKSAKPSSTETADPSPAPAAAEPAPEPSAPSAASTTTGSTSTCGTNAAAAAPLPATAAAHGAEQQDKKTAVNAERSKPLQDEDLFYMDEAEAIRQIEKEIEEQIERNHYKALGI